MKKYHKLKYELENILIYFYNNYYFFILDNWSKNGYIIINNIKKDMVMNCLLSIYNDTNSECIIDTESTFGKESTFAEGTFAEGTFGGGGGGGGDDKQLKISYNKQIKITLPKNKQDLKIVITNINYVPNYLNLKIIGNIISYKDLFLTKCSIKKYDELYNPKRDNLYIETDIINKYYGSQYKLKVLSDYIELLNDKIKSGIIVNKNQIQKLDFNNYNEGLDKKYLKIVCENIINKDDNIFKLLIIVHIGSYELGIEIINKFINIGINDTYLYCFNVNNDVNNDIKILIEENFKNYIISSTINFGNDIVPSLLLYNYINSKYKIQYILKIQTKGNRIWFDGNIDILITEHINKMLYLFDNSNIDSIGSKKFLVKMDKYNLDLLHIDANNIEDILKLERNNFIKIILNLPCDFNYNNYKKNNYEILCKYFNKKNISNIELIKHYLKVGKKQNYSYKNCNKINFFAGTMFFCKKEIFDNMISKYTKLINASIINNFYYDNELFSKSSPIHALERLFGYYYNNIPITCYKKPNLFISYVGTNKTNIDKLNDLNAVKLVINGCLDTHIDNNTIIDTHYLNIYNLFNNTDINNTDINGYTLLISDNIKSNDIDYIYNYLHFNTYDFISYNELYIPQYHFPIKPMWILKNKLINKFINMYKKNKITFLLDFSNMILSDYNPKILYPL